MPHPSKRSEVEPFRAMDVLARANALEASGRHILHMEVGQPGAAAPKPVLDAARAALDGGRLGYTEARGLPVLRDAIAGYYRDSFGAEVPTERIIATTGSSAGFNLTFLAAFDPGDRIAIAAPGYPAYRNILRALGIEPVEIEVGPETRWALTPELIEAAHREAPLKGVLVASPANPTGTMMTPEALRTLIAACEDMGLWFISDEIYHGLVFAGQQETALTFSDQTIVINSFSKYYCMTGWRIGWMVVPDVLVRPIERLAQSLYISPPELSQRAAAAAFSATEELEAVKAVYARNRALLVERMPALGFDEMLPVDGAFYLYASVRPFANDSTAFARSMLEEAGIAATPGADFDPFQGTRFIRFSFAGTHEDMREAMDRLGDWLPRQG
ncbi:aminotransferase class I/II-fold pyridoxal phosphate-dependent enzyme [Stappia taiwanensis]|uniref:aspartate transaminase n=1 Tax=Stappia taiwanensis TaxID=992267 RepID=A0A838XXJ2_9HYPH|nr:aminotransferase class I/II-fold pyridoxal phosphate-dependent enzyme [Stappia taiwanensis]MBA4611613.1 aminotransferase class I/II-fold pyridoxal phosphate-dependent enzyme [Stappia taiwanensis]GGE98244.1 1-aminocyclopropane-1-carboxylate deaminase [Stappia taiwanensis]